MEWWKDAIIYQIYPRSFQDSNGDGIGDIPGIISRLDYLQDLGISAVWLCPVYRSPNADNGYDISDYRDINPEYGTMADMERLIRDAARRGIRIIMDLPLNHTSVQHPWFRQGRRRGSPYSDYYYWSRGDGGGGLPNNWTGFFGGDCWEYDVERCEYYLHLFAREQADLNYHNSNVLEEMKGIMRFWLGKGVAGFRLGTANLLWKDSLESSKKHAGPVGMDHYLSLDGTHEILRQLRKVLEEYDAFAVGEAVSATTAMARDLCGRDRRELHMVLSAEHMECDRRGARWFGRKFRPREFFDCIVRWQKRLDWNAVYLENHDQPRSIPRFGSRRYWKKSGKLLATLLLTLRGTPFLYQGEEIGMTGFDFTRMEQVNDLESRSADKILAKRLVPAGLRWKIISRTSRDNARTPFQWTGGPQAGFTSSYPWLDVNHNFVKVNLASEQRDPDSIWAWYQDLCALRKDSAVLRRGDFVSRETGDQVFAYSRTLGDEELTVALNFSDKTAQTSQRGGLVRSNYPRRGFNGTLQPWEAVILKPGWEEEEVRK